MITPTTADNTMIHNGITSDFGSGTGMAVILISSSLRGLSAGLPMCANLDTRDTAKVDKFNGSLGASYISNKRKKT